MVRTRSGLDTAANVANHVVEIYTNPAQAGQHALGIAANVADAAGYNPEDLAAIVIRRGQNYARNLVFQGLQQAGQYVYNRLNEQLNDYLNQQPGPSTPNRPIPNNQPDSAIDINQTPTHQGPQVMNGAKGPELLPGTTTTTTNAGGNMATNPNGHQGSLEHLPKGPTNGPHTATKRYNNCYRVYIENTFTANEPESVLWPIGDQDNSNNFCDAESPNVEATRFYTPWRQIPNNNIKNYITPQQWNTEMRKGAVGYKVKSCNIKVHGLYNMQRYKYSNDLLQGQDTAYMAICEPKNSLFLNSRPANYDRDQMHNDEKTFTLGDEYEYQNWLGTQPTTIQNKLPQYKIVIPVKNSSLDTNRDLWYPDLTTHESQTLVRNGQTYDWRWRNSDDRFIATYPPYLTDSQEDATENAGYARLPIQLLNDGIQSHFEYYCGTGIQVSVPINQPFAGIGLDQSGGKHPRQMEPLLAKIPQLRQEGTGVEPITHSAWLYLDYGIEIEFIYGQNIYTRGMAQTRRDGRYGFNQENYTAAIQYMGNPKQYNYWSQCNRTKQKNQFNAPWYFNAEPRVPGGFVEKTTVMDNTLTFESLRIAEENKPKAKKPKTT